MDKEKLEAGIAAGKRMVQEIDVMLTQPAALVRGAAEAKEAVVKEYTAVKQGLLTLVALAEAKLKE